MKTKNSLYRFLSAFTIVALLAVLVGPTFANAASLTSISDVMSRQKASTKSTHTIKFTSTTAMVAAGTIALNFSTFTGTVAIGDVQICHGATGIEHGTAAVTGTSCTTTDETLAASNGASTVWGFNYTSTTLTLTAPSGTWTNLISAGQKVTIFITATNIQNPAVSTPAITITNSNGDSGTFTVPIIDDDTVSISASVNETLTFNIKAGTTNTGVAPYSVPLGTLSAAGATFSNGSTINSIWVNIGTNTSGGAIVSVQSANGALKSTSTPGDTIPSATATMAAGTANYGICVKANTAGTGTLNKVGPFASTCTYSATDSVGGLTTSPQTILNTNSAPLNTGVGEIVMSAENSATTPAHTDYSDTLTFIGTGTF